MNKQARDAPPARRQVSRSSKFYTKLSQLSQPTSSIDVCQTLPGVIELIGFMGFRGALGLQVDWLGGLRASELEGLGFN